MIHTLANIVGKNLVVIARGNAILSGIVLTVIMKKHSSVFGNVMSVAKVCVTIVTNLRVAVDTHGIQYAFIAYWKFLILTVSGVRGDFVRTTRPIL